MSAQRILLHRPEKGRCAAALLIAGRIEDLLVDPPEEHAGEPAPGAIHRGRIDRLIPQMGAAFVQIGGGHKGYLREARGLRAGQSLLVQVVSHAEAGKAAPVTARILYKGRLVILTPQAPGINLSRQIKGEAERTRLKAVAEGAAASLLHGDAPAPGFILRSAALGAEAAEIAAELGDLLAVQAGVEAEAGAGPGLALPAAGAVATALRDWDGKVEDDPDAFTHAGLWDEIEALSSPLADLRGAGFLYIEPTRALVAVDVNTADAFSADAALNANLEAARELPRQLRLRGLGGVILVDFAPLAKRDRRRIEDALKTSFARDPVETVLSGWTPLGLFEIQRKRERRPVSF